MRSKLPPFECRKKCLRMVKKRSYAGFFFVPFSVYGFSVMTSL